MKVTGATVHFVDEGTDTGPIILQKAVAVEEDDTPEILQRRVNCQWKSKSRRRESEDSSKSRPLELSKSK